MVALPSWLRPAGGGFVMRIHAQPGAKTTALSGVHGDALKVKLHAPPVDGKANAELIRFLASKLNCRKAQVSLVAGETSREKSVAVVDVPLELILTTLQIT